ncbi:nuclear pore complex protein Nup50 [Haematobia irritans]|uniref:nuclear pore complex protein Nup50 n=1 Tax=Haematobia irritans TaxID=7368 RepID=UPI003F4FC366
MSGKRQATSDLNHDNWDRDEEPEERGTFKTANEDELKNRVIKKAARRRVAGTDTGDSGSATKSVFSGFSGFGKTPATSTTAASSPFSFLSKIPAAEKPTEPSAPVEPQKPTTSTFTFGSGSAATSNSKETKDDTSNKSSSEYYSKLKGLNQAVSEWIKTHVDKNPLCILTPIFKDYEKYLAELDKEKSTSSSTSAGTSTTTGDNKLSSISTSSSSIGTFKFSDTNSSAKPAAAATTPPKFSFGTNASASTGSPGKTNGFSFGLKKPDDKSTNETKPAASSTFSFGLKSSSETSTATSSSTTTASTGFTFGKPTTTTEGSSSAPKPFSFTPGATPFSFGNIKPPEAPATTASNDNDDEEEEPPKNEFKQVVEEDAVYSKKCKVYVKKDGNFVDKGVGTLYLKPVESSGKTQLIVRADTNLGNILVNLILSSAIPAQRMGKNNVMMVCIPTPDVEKPTPMLLRVKNGEEADDLLAEIEKHKK